MDDTAKALISFTPKQLRGLRELAFWAAQRRKRVRVVGHSMEPTLSHGDYVLVDPAAQPLVNDVVLAEHPTDPVTKVVKRLAAFVGDDHVDLRSDNSDAGTDSRTWGPVERSKIVGVVTLEIRRAFAQDQGLRQRLKR